MHKNLVPDPCYILVNNPKQALHAKESFENRVFYILKEDYHKVIKKLTLFFFLNQGFFNRQSYQKRDLQLVTSSLLGYKTSSQKSI